MNTHDSLTAEIERVISAPYAVCLKTLRDILVSCETSTVQAWADTSTCQLEPLATCIRKAFDTWDYTLEVFELLVLARPFRDAFLAQYPSMLDAFLQKAILPEAPSAVFRTCVSMLSEPLPPSVPLPFAAQEFFMRSFDEAVKSTDEYHVSMVHKMLDGACQDLLGILPRDRGEYIEEKGYELLKNSAATPSHGPNEDRHRLQILSLGLMGILARSCDAQSEGNIPSDTVASNDLPAPPRRPDAVKHLEEIPRMFQTKGARATIRLTVMVAIGILGTHAKEMHDDTARYLKIVADVLSIMPSTVRQKFLEDDAKFVSKLVEKVQKAGDHPGVQLQGLLSVALLHEGRPLPESVVSAYTRALLSARNLPGNCRAYADAARLSLPLFAAQLSEEFVRELLCFSIEAAVQTTSRISELQWLRMLVKHLGDVAQEAPAIRRQVLLTLSLDKFEGQLRKLLSLQVTDPGSCGDGKGSCGCQKSASSAALGLDTCTLLLRTAIMAQTDEIGMHTRVGLDLLEKQQQLASYRMPVCGYLRHTQEPTPPLVLLQQRCTPHTEPDSRDWRERLAKDVEIQERHRLELVERRMGEVCRDLEARCEQVEEPLRLEQQKARRLEEELQTSREQHGQELQRLKDQSEEELQLLKSQHAKELQTLEAQHSEEIQMLKQQHGELVARASDLESHAVDRELFIQGLEAEKAQVDQDCQRALDSNDDLVKRAENLQRQLDEANQTAETTLSSARQDYDRMKAELRALLTKEETRNEEQAALLERMRTHIAGLEDDLDIAQACMEEEQSISEELRSNLEEAMQQFEEQKLAKLQAQAEVGDLLEKEAAYIDQLRHAQAALVESRGASAELKAEHDALIKSTTAETESMRKQAELDLHRLMEEASNEREALDSQLQLAKEEIDCLVEDKDGLLAELQARETRIKMMQRQLGEVSEALRAAEARVDELDSWRNNILSVMGAPTGGMLRNAATRSRNQGPRSGPTSPANANKRRSFAEYEESAGNVVDEDSDRTESERTQSPRQLPQEIQRSESAGSTPKRAKVQRQQPFKLPTLRAAASTSADARRHSTRQSQGRGKSSAASTRQPLSDVSAGRGNVSPARKPAGSGAKNVNHEGGSGDGGGSAAAPSSARSAKQQQTSQFGGSFDVSDFLEGTPFTPSSRRQQHIESFGSGSTTVDV